MIHTDAVVIGAGPTGLFQLFQLGLLGLNAHVIDVLPEAGGQCAALYPDKPIYDVPGLPCCSGRELVERLLQQARPFLTCAAGAPLAQADNLHLGQIVEAVSPLADGGFEVRAHSGMTWHCRAVFIAAGAGAFVPRSINLPGLADAPNVHHHLPMAAHAPWRGQHLVIAGGGDEALSSVLHVLADAQAADAPARLTLLHRRDQFQAEPALHDAVRNLLAQGQLTLAVGMPTGAQLDGDRLTSLTLLGADEAPHDLPLDHLLIRQGMSPKLGNLTQWGMDLERKQVWVSPATFESSVPGIYAVGDINTYPGKKRLLLCGFHEATLAAHHAAATLNPDAPQHLLYTTTSALLHERLGVATSSP
jgi:thioredoxin reductase (NADPH)